MNTYQKEVMVGILVLIAAVAFFGGALWLRGASLGGPDINVLYSDISNLKEGSPVRISGAPVGRVSSITYLGVGRVNVGLKFSQHIVPTSNATAIITGIGMLGDEMIAFNPGSGTPLAPGDTLHGTISGGIFSQAANFAGAAQKTLARLDSMLDPGMVADLRSTLKSTNELMTYLADHQHGPTAQINATMTALRGTSAKLDSVLAGVDAHALQSRVDSTLRATSAATVRLTVMSNHLDSLLVSLTHGQGTMGKLMTDTTLYVDLRHTLEATTALINELEKNPNKIGITVRIP
jgi:phospholipid/cholesterol/gamma-HCH transport system substrate-binding protein